MYDKSNLENKFKAKYTAEELEKMKNALDIIEKYKENKKNLVKTNSIFGSFIGSFLDDYINECEKIIKNAYHVNKIIVPKEEQPKKSLQESISEKPKNIQINVKKQNKPATYIDKLEEPQRKQINKLVDEFMKTVIVPNINTLDNKKYAALFEGLANYSAWLYLHK